MVGTPPPPLISTNLPARKCPSPLPPRRGEENFGLICQFCPPLPNSLRAALSALLLSCRHCFPVDPCRERTHSHPLPFIPICACVPGKKSSSQKVPDADPTLQTLLAASRLCCLAGGVSHAPPSKARLARPAFHTIFLLIDAARAPSGRLRSRLQKADHSHLLCALLAPNLCARGPARENQPPLAWSSRLACPCCSAPTSPRRCVRRCGPSAQEIPLSSFFILAPQVLRVLPQVLRACRRCDPCGSAAWIQLGDCMSFFYK
jgi:hypothetical protein